MYQITWTTAAIENYEAILDFVFQYQSIHAITELDDKVKQLESRLQKHKHLCPAAKSDPQLRRCVVTKNVSLIYRVVKQTIQVVAVVDNRTDHSF